MIDYFALALMHGLLLVALLRLVRRSDVDADAALGPEPADAPETPDPRTTRRNRRTRRDGRDA